MVELLSFEHAAQVFRCLVDEQTLELQALELERHNIEVKIKTLRKWRNKVRIAIPYADYCILGTD